eukprot:GSA120T00020883001.1
MNSSRSSGTGVYNSSDPFSNPYPTNSTDLHLRRPKPEQEAAGQRDVDHKGAARSRRSGLMNKMTAATGSFSILEETQNRTSSREQWTVASRPGRPPEREYYNCSHPFKYNFVLHLPSA